MTIRTALGKQTQAYDILVVATGSRSIADEHGVPWKLSLDGYEATKAALHKIQERVKAAKSIVLGGGGPTGIETAGELGFEYGQAKEITLVSTFCYLMQDGLTGIRSPRRASSSLVLLSTWPPSLKPSSRN